MRVWRLTKDAYRATALLGLGALKTPGRWHSAGTAIAYTSASAEIMMLEALVHVRIHQLPTDYMALQFEVPDDAVETLSSTPPDWDMPPPYIEHVQAIGDEWVRSRRSLALQVPSSVFPPGSNVLINPRHPRFVEITEIAGDPFVFPPRLLAVLMKRRGGG